MKETEKDRWQCGASVSREDISGVKGPGKFFASLREKDRRHRIIRFTLTFIIRCKSMYVGKRALGGELFSPQPGLFLWRLLERGQNWRRLIHCGQDSSQLLRRVLLTAWNNATGFWTCVRHQA